MLSVRGSADDTALAATRYAVGDDERRSAVEPRERNGTRPPPLTC